WRVLQSADAPALTLDDEVTLQVPQGQQLGLWAIDAQGGEYLELSFGEDNAEGNYFWLYDASGRLVFDGNPAKGYYYDANLDAPGRYTLVVSTNAAPGVQGDGQVTLWARLQAQPERVVHDLGALADDAVTVLSDMTVSYGHAHVFAFDVAQAGTYRIEVPPASSSYYWYLSGPSYAYGDQYSDVRSSFQSVYLKPGHYELEVYSYTDEALVLGEGA